MTLGGRTAVDPDLIQRQPKGCFATFIRGLTDRVVPMSFPFFELERLPRTTREERKAIRDFSRSAFAEPWRNGAQADAAGDGDETGGDGDTARKRADDGGDIDPLRPSPELRA